MDLQKIKSRTGNGQTLSKQIEDLREEVQYLQDDLEFQQELLLELNKSSKERVNSAYSGTTNY